ncbi:cell envelope integrity protein CreD [Psychrobacter sp. A3]|uniref:cell envelope integrity protein CreD n=1 Tax=Psychrobacter sp. A3 TaxID=2992754 RepID=UPI00237B8329|nr:cell envelope integrity protein CreD [Psychrobacter sp. A3]MDE0490916.1 cell envelope integrity protein CreD [Psychrobacter sp. A3]
MQKTLFIKLTVIASLCVLFAIGLTMFSSVITERQYYADSVVREIADQHVNPQEIITPFIAIPVTTTPECTSAANKANKCAPPFTTIDTIFAAQSLATQNLDVSTDTYQRGIYHATSYSGDISFKQSYKPQTAIESIETADVQTDMPDTTAVHDTIATAKQTITHWEQAKLIIPVSDLRGVPTLPTITIDKQTLKATYPSVSMLNGLSYVEVALPQNTVTQLKANATALPNTANSNINANQAIDITIDLPLAGISNLNTVPTGSNFELSMQSNWHAPNFTGKALPNAKDFSAEGFTANWQNQYLTVANNQYLSQCLSTANNSCTVDSRARLDSGNHADYEAAAVVVQEAAGSIGSTNHGNLNSVRLNSFGVSFAEPNDVYLQTERTMKYALLLILISFGTFFLFEVIKSSRIHPIQYLLVGCALLTFYVLLLPLAEQIAFWQAYAVAGSSCVGLIGWYTYYVLGGVKRAVIFTAILAGLYAAFYGILTTEDLNLLLGAVFCFILLACVMVMTRKIDWYKVA